MINTELIIQSLEKVSGIKLERAENGMVNMIKFIEDYKNKFPKEFKTRFGDARPDQAITKFFEEKINNNLKYSNYEK